MSEVAELKPCPFCGGTHVMMFEPTCRRDTPYNPADRLFPLVRCQCGAEAIGKDEDYRGATAVAAWNTRPAEATLTARADAAEARLAKAVEALTPSGETKAAYIGEFSFTVDFTNEDGEDDYMRVDVPWTTIKEIMAAIRARAALSELEG